MREMYRTGRITLDLTSTGVWVIHQLVTKKGKECKQAARFYTSLELACKRVCEAAAGGTAASLAEYVSAYRLEVGRLEGALATLLPQTNLCHPYGAPGDPGTGSFMPSETKGGRYE